MAGNKSGGMKTAKTIKAKYGEQFYKINGAKGGRAKISTKGFGANRERAVSAGKRAGEISKRGHKFIKEVGENRYYINRETDLIVVYNSSDGYKQPIIPKNKLKIEKL